MIAPRRLQLHQDIARALESQYGPRREEHAAELSEHFAQSTDPLDLTRAIEYGELAAKRAMAIFDYGEAVAHFERCLSVQEVLDPDDKARRCDLLLALGEALMPAGEAKRAADVTLEEAFKLAATVADDARSARACTLAVAALLNYGAADASLMPEFEAWVSRADTHAAPNSPDRVLATFAISNLERNRAQWIEAEGHRKEALEIARALRDPASLFFAAIGSFSYVTPRMQSAVEDVAAEILGWPREGTSPSFLAIAFGHGGHILLAAGIRVPAEALWQEVDEIAARTMNPVAVAVNMRNAIDMATLAGHLDEALEISDELVTRGEQLGVSTRALQYSVTASLLAQIYLGRPAKAFASIRTLREAAPGGVEHDPFRVRLALALAHAGRQQEATEEILGFIGHDTSDSQLSACPTMHLGIALEVAIALREKELADRLSRALLLSDRWASPSLNAIRDAVAERARAFHATGERASAWTTVAGRDTQASTGLLQFESLDENG